MTRTIGSWLTVHEPRQVEVCDQATNISYDVRQEASIRSFLAITKKHGQIEGDFAEALDEHADIAQASLRYARLDLCHNIFKQACDLEEIQIADDHAEDELHAIEVSDSLKVFYETSTKHERKALELMTRLQAQKDRGVNPSPSDRVLLCRLRKQTGWTLSTTLL